jgi:glutamine amidotransferase
MQLLGRHSEEGPAGGTELLGMLPFNVVRFTPPDAAHKVPHMGWNNLHDLQTPLFEGLGGATVPGDESPQSDLNQQGQQNHPSAADYVYFVHSYYAPVGDYTIAQASYPVGAPFSAGVRHRNFYGVQFHVEKSGPVGEHILRNFLTSDLS